MQSKEIVLITGGAGFIGANLSQKLIKRGFKVHILCKKDTNLWRLNSILQKITVHTVSLSSLVSLKKLIKRIKPNVIFHLAAYGVNSYQSDVKKMIKVNILGTINLLLASKDLPYDIFINAGSSSEYGFKNEPMKEIDLLEPNSFYSATKASSVHLCQVFAKKFNKPIVNIRLFSVFGPYEDNNRLIPTIITSLIKKKTIKITSNISRHDFIYIDDVTNMFVKLLKKGRQLSGKIINSGTGKEYTASEVVRTLFKVARRKTLVKKGYFAREWDFKHWVADNDLAFKLIGWRPLFSLDQGLKRTYNWFIKNKSIYEKKF